jgi:hypothetical protein
MFVCEHIPAVTLPQLAEVLRIRIIYIYIYYIYIAKEEVMGEGLDRSSRHPRSVEHIVERFAAGI